MYSRLKRCKDIADKLAQDKQQPVNPLAIKLGLADPETQNFGIEAGENPAQYYYQNLLSLAEKLFENELDVNSFEETLRFMFGTKAYIMFTLDRVVATIVKQVRELLYEKSQRLADFAADSDHSRRHEESRTLCALTARPSCREHYCKATDRVQDAGGECDWSRGQCVQD